MHGLLWQDGGLCVSHTAIHWLSASGERPREQIAQEPPRSRPEASVEREIIMQKFDAIDAALLRTDVPDFRVGDNVKVHVNIIEGTRSRVQVFQGVVISRSGHGVRETFAVRKVSFQVGVERKFPVHSPIIDHIELVSRGDVRRAKLYYLRKLRGKAAKIREKRDA